MTPKPPLALHVFATFAVGGPQVRFAAIANHLGASWRHMIVAMDGNTDCRARLDPSLDVSFPPVPDHNGGILSNARRFRRCLRAWRPDVLVSSNWGSIEWAVANFFPLVRHIHIVDGFGPEESMAQLPRRVWLRGLVLRRTQLVVPSLTLRAIASDIWRLPHVRYLPNGVDLARFAPAPHAARTPPVIGTIAALRPEKNLPRLLRAFRELSSSRDARLVIVGDGPQSGELQALAQTLGIADRVEFPGPTDRAEDFYRGFDVFVLSSDTEQMPLSVLEAMGCALPVVATDVGDISAMLAPENAAFVTAKSATALAAALGRMLEAPDRARAIGAANRAKAEREYDQNTMFAAYAALLAGPRR